MAGAVLGLVMLVGLLAYARPAAAASATQQDAYVACINDPSFATVKKNFDPNAKCSPRPGGIREFYILYSGTYTYCSGSGGLCLWVTDGPWGPCLLPRPDVQAAVAVDGLGTVNACDGQCAYALIDGEQTSNGYGKSLMVGTWHSTGQACAAPPPPGWGGDGSSQPPPAQLCGGGSCYDPGSGNYCMNDAAGKQVCVPGPKPGIGGGCASSDKGTICTGSPPPLPPKPPSSPISDPPTEITSSDNFTHSQTTPPPAGSPAGTPPTVTNTTVTTNTYGTGGQGQSPTTSGQKTGDMGPAPASSTGGTDKGTASGGGDCNTPPICTGDAPTCMVVSQTWLGRCKKDSYDLDGDGVPDWVGKGSDLYKPDQPADVPINAVVSTETATLDGIDASGWAGNTCPQLPNLSFFDREITYGDQALFCDWLAKLRPIFLLVCGFVAMRILASGGKS
jgi:hypothetical protein